MEPKLVILVTAGSAGLGAEVCRLFARRGYRVVINYSSNTARAAQLCKEINRGQEEHDGKPSHMTIQADLAQREDVQRLVQETISAMGRLDVVFSNGGWTRFTDTTSLDDNVNVEDWDRAFTMNVKSHLWLLHASKEHLKKTEGAFITTASVAGVQGMGSSLAYGATKAAQIHMVKGLASMVGPEIRVNTISPGMLQTEWAERFSAEQKDAMKQKSKLKRFAELEDVALQVLTLAISRSMTGTNIIVDGGWVS
ncbi:short chain dehydrogenase reductase [Stachybotrys elegans]|uniref:Short chain dehydrogenase reductase n=1 Tax=Stachybotrys elegans TaxID=80388 RepID=A0A8K0WUM5_9HYPO|nr:short chain dehydrogenase reductase [Stachybotrys elegans]